MHTKPKLTTAYDASNNTGDTIMSLLDQEF